MKKYPNVTLKIIFKHKDRILMLRHPNGILEFPGGRMKWRESIFEALKRELKEELKYDLEKLPNVFDLWNFISKNGKRHSVMIYFMIKLKEIPEFYPWGKIQMRWFSKGDILSINLIEDTRFINKIFRS